MTRAVEIREGSFPVWQAGRADCELSEGCGVGRTIRSGSGRALGVAQEHPEIVEHGLGNQVAAIE